MSPPVSPQPSKPRPWFRAVRTAAFRAKRQSAWLSRRPQGVATRERSAPTWARGDPSAGLCAACPKARGGPGGSGAGRSITLGEVSQEERAWSSSPEIACRSSPSRPSLRPDGRGRGGSTRDGLPFAIASAGTMARKHVHTLGGRAAKAAEPTEGDVGPRTRGAGLMPANARRRDRSWGSRRPTALAPARTLSPCPRSSDATITAG
jgi:hypothetical protein